MDMDLKYQLRDKLDAIAQEYGMIGLMYLSFVRCYGYHMQPLSATDAVDALNALLDVTTGVRIEIEADGVRNDGVWFGGGRVWRFTGRWGVPESEQASAHNCGQEVEQDAGEREQGG